MKRKLFEGENEEWADDHWHFEIEDPEVKSSRKGIEDIKNGGFMHKESIGCYLMMMVKESFKRRLKEELDELDSKPLIMRGGKDVEKKNK